MWRPELAGGEGGEVSGDWRDHGQGAQFHFQATRWLGVS